MNRGIRKAAMGAGVLALVAGCPGAGNDGEQQAQECAAFLYLFGDSPVLSDVELIDFIDSVSTAIVPEAWRSPETDIVAFSAEVRPDLGSRTADPQCSGLTANFAPLPARSGDLVPRGADDARLRADDHERGEDDIVFAPSTLDVPCGSSTGDRQVICAANSLPAKPGSHLVAFARHKAAIPPANPGRSYVFALVVDSDGAAVNNWVYRNGFDWDYFQGTDRWYQLIWDHVSKAWTVTVTQVDNAKNTTTVASSVRAIREKDTVLWVINSDEFPVARPKYRLTAFVHDGRFTVGMRGGDVTDANPTLPLRDPGP